MVINEEQKRVYDWLRNELSLPIFADAYKGAIHLLNKKTEGYISFVAHAGRDLMNRLASTVAGIESERVQYSQHVDYLKDRWESEWGLSEGLLQEGEKKGNFIPIEVCERISKMIEEHNSGRIRSSEADGLFFNRFLDYSDKDKIPKNFLIEWKSAKKWFLGHAHLREKEFSGGVEVDLVKHFGCLDGYLYIAASSQYERLKALDEILDETNI